MIKSPDFHRRFGVRAADPGHDLPGVMPMRTAADAERLKRALAGQPIRTALVVGASMTGIKLVELLCAAGVKTTMVDGAGWMFPLAAFQSTAQRIQARLEQKGRVARV